MDEIIEWAIANTDVRQHSTDFIVGRFGTKRYRIFIIGGNALVIDIGWDDAKVCHTLEEFRSALTVSTQ